MTSMAPGTVETFSIALAQHWGSRFLPFELHTSFERRSLRYRTVEDGGIIAPGFAPG